LLLPLVHLLLVSDHQEDRLVQLQEEEYLIALPWLNANHFDGDFIHHRQFAEFQEKNLYFMVIIIQLLYVLLSIASF